MYRQGDILLISVDEIPQDAKINKRKKGQKIVLALGEVTGHAHVITMPEVKWFGSMDDVQYVQSANPFAVTHEEHGALNLPAGAYAVIRQVGYTPAELVRVVD